MMFRLALLAAAALSTLAPALRAQEPAAQAEQARAVAAERVARNYHERVASQIAASGQARDLALAAVLRRIAIDGPDGPAAGDADVRAWRAAAAAQAGDDVLANALLMMGAEGDADPVVRQAAQRWARAEPDNIGPRLFLEDGVESMLADARAFSRFDLHMYDQVRWVQAVLLRHPPSASEQSTLFGNQAVPLEEHAAMTAMGLWAAGSIPPIEDLVQACDGAGLRADPGRRDACGRIARILVDRSDSNLGRLAGIDMLARMAGTAAERAEAQALQRHMDWQMLEWGRVVAGQPRGGAAQFAQLLRDPAIRTERDLVERILAGAGIASEPPAGWQPPRR